MQSERDRIRADVLALLEELGDDWEHEGEITEDTDLVQSMGFESLDIVVLATALQERYPQEIPFSEFFAELGQRNAAGLTVREWVDFVHTHVASQPEGSPTGGQPRS